jgi:hypothetical protein
MGTMVLPRHGFKKHQKSLAHGVQELPSSQHVAGAGVDQQQQDVWDLLTTIIIAPPHHVRSREMCKSSHGICQSHGMQTAWGAHSWHAQADGGREHVNLGLECTQMYKGWQNSKDIENTTLYGVVTQPQASSTQAAPSPP